MNAFWLTAPPIGFASLCEKESERMRYTREAWLLSSGEVLRPRSWRDERDFATKPKQQEAA